ncbi:MAG: FHA domain-containing protein [Rhodoglobus sp.]
MSCFQCGADLPSGAMFCGECGSAVRAEMPYPWSSAAVQVSSAEERDTSYVAPKRDSRLHEPLAGNVPLAKVGEVPVSIAQVSSLSSNVSSVDDGDIEQTRIVSRTPQGERFVLQFSTGESVTVFGTGLVGRHPVPEPSEHFDTLVTIIDPGKSVSKTHLQFGQEGGSFWVSDRFSGNGTVVREPEVQPKRCDPAKRYRVVRGTRIEIGEQFFIVS